MRPISKGADYDSLLVCSLQDIARGRATADQQRLALKWIVEICAEAYDPQIPTNSYEAAAVHGRKSVGLEIARLANMPAALIDKLREAENGKRD